MTKDLDLIIGNLQKTATTLFAYLYPFRQKELLCFAKICSQVK
jgi:hypothetical protein